MPDYKKFQKSIADELLSIKSRVSDLLDKVHHGEDGRYKEAIFVDVLRRALPDIAKIGTGFVIGDDNEQTSQIDIIVYDGRHSVIFQKGDFVIVPKASVLGIIEVKTRLGAPDGSTKLIKKKAIEDAVKAIKKAGVNGKIVMRLRGRDLNGNICYNRHNGMQGIFNGIMAYECNDLVIDQQVREALKESNGFLNHIAFGKDIFLKYWNHNLHNQLQHNLGIGDRKESPFCRFYEFSNDSESLAFGFFISNLIESIHIKILNNYPERQDFLFPLPKGKNAYKIEGADIEIATGEHTDQWKLSETSHICEECGSSNMVSFYMKKQLCLKCHNKQWEQDDGDEDDCE